jgi:hypothetical protein
MDHSNACTEKIFWPDAFFTLDTSGARSYSVNMTKRTATWNGRTVSVRALYAAWRTLESRAVVVKGGGAMSALTIHWSSFAACWQVRCGSRVLSSDHRTRRQAECWRDLYIGG